LWQYDDRLKVKAARFTSVSVTTLVGYTKQLHGVIIIVIIIIIIIMISSAFSCSVNTSNNKSLQQKFT